MAQDIFVEGFEGIVGNITTNNYLTFAEEEIPVEGKGHNKALHMSVKCMDHIEAKVLRQWLITQRHAQEYLRQTTIQHIPHAVELDGGMGF